MVSSFVYYLSYLFPHLVCLLKIGVADNLMLCTHASAEEVTFEGAFLITVNPSLQTTLCPLGSEVRLIFMGGGEEIDVVEKVVLGVHGVHAVYEGLHLGAHIVVVDGSGPAYHVSILHALHDGWHIVFEDASTRRLARQAPDTELDFLALQRDELHIVAGGLCAGGETFRQSVAVSTFAEACRYNNYFLHIVFTFYIFFFDCLIGSSSLVLYKYR